MPQLYRTTAVANHPYFLLPISINFVHLDIGEPVLPILTEEGTEFELEQMKFHSVKPVLQNLQQSVCTVLSHSMILILDQ